MSGKLISSQNNTSHLPNCEEAVQGNITLWKYYITYTILKKDKVVPPHTMEALVGGQEI
jgi:hypothetical protein